MSEVMFSLMLYLYKHYPSLSPFEIRNTPAREVFMLFARTVMNDRQENGESEYVNKRTKNEKPIPISQGGWY